MLCDVFHGMLEHIVDFSLVHGHLGSLECTVPIVVLHDLVADEVFFDFVNRQVLSGSELIDGNREHEVVFKQLPGVLDLVSIMPYLMQFLPQLTRFPVHSWMQADFRIAHHLPFIHETHFPLKRKPI